MQEPIDEKEINLKIVDLQGLLVFLRSKAEETIIEKQNTYFENPNDALFYIRLEDITTGAQTSRALTIKYGFNDDANGLSRRKEMTTPIEDAVFFEAMFGVMGLVCTGRKRKIRHAFHIDDLEVTVDEWTDSDLGNRLEIEGDDEAAIWKFKRLIERFVEAELNE